MGHGDIHPRPASYEHLYENESLATGGFRFGILAAAAIHLTIFAITWPTMARLVAENTTRKPRIYRLRQVVFEPPQPKIEKPRTKISKSAKTVPLAPLPLEPTIARKHRDKPEEPDVQPKPPAVTVPPPPQFEEPGPTTIRVGSEIAPPRLTYRVEPRYPPAAKKLHLTGAVVLEMLIDPEGRVADVTVLRGQPFGLTESAVEAANQWRFEPSIYKGRPVSILYTLTIQFRLESRM